MQGGITNIQALKTWFYTTGKPFFTLRYYKPGAAGEVVARNKNEDDLTKAWELLEANVLGQAANTRALLQVFVYDQGKENNYTALTNVDMQPGGVQTAVAGIGSLPGMYGHHGSFEAALKAEREKWEMEKRIDDLEAALEAPKDWGEQITGIFERISTTPVGNVLIARIMGVPMTPQAAAPIAGPVGDAEDTFEEDLNVTTEALGVSDTELMAKLRRLVEAQPDMAKQILNSI